MGNGACGGDHDDLESHQSADMGACQAACELEPYCAVFCTGTGVQGVDDCLRYMNCTNLAIESAAGLDITNFVCYVKPGVNVPVMKTHAVSNCTNLDNVTDGGVTKVPAEGIFGGYMTLLLIAIGYVTLVAWLIYKPTPTC